MKPKKRNPRGVELAGQLSKAFPERSVTADLGPAATIDNRVRVVDHFGSCYTVGYLHGPAEARVEVFTFDHAAIEAHRLLSSEA